MTDPQSQADLIHQAGALFRQARWEEASSVYRRVLERQPAHSDALQMLGLAQLQLGRPAVSLQLFDEALQALGDHPGLHFNRGLVLLQLGQPEAAATAFGKTVQADKRHFKAYIMRADVLRQLGRVEEALDDYRSASAVAPENPDVDLATGHLLYQMQRYAPALACFERAAALRPGHPDAWVNLGSTHIRLASHREAIHALDKALALDPFLHDAHFNRGLALASLGQHEAAVESFSACLSLSPGLTEARKSRGLSLGRLGRNSEAIAEFGLALQSDPAHARTWVDQGNVLFAAGRVEDAISAYEKALSLGPPVDFAFDALVQAKAHLCVWRTFDADVDRVEAWAGAPLMSPTNLLAISNSAPLQKACAEAFAAVAYPAQPAPLEPRAPSADSRIHVGYFSSDFHEHATAHLMAGLFEQHDRARFRISAFSFGNPPTDGMHERLKQSFDQFIDVSGLSDEEVVSLARRMGMDIAVDLKGLTRGSRPRLFTMRVAPVQISYLGYPSTLGTRSIDYLVADGEIIGRSERQHYTEQIIELPGSYQVNDDKRPISDKAFTRAELGLPARGIVFCCFNAHYKLTPAVFDVWMRLLNEVQDSVLWLIKGLPQGIANLRKEASARGVDPSRLVFAERMDLPSHLARHAAADLFLDTLPCNAHTTASDALWAGLPVVTCRGGTFASRVSASLLHALALPELVAQSLPEYHSLAKALALDSSRLAALKDKLRANRQSQSLFNTRLFARRLEAAFEIAQARQRGGLPPAHIDMESIAQGAGT